MYIQDGHAATIVNVQVFDARFRRTRLFGDCVLARAPNNSAEGPDFLVEVRRTRPPLNARPYLRVSPAFLEGGPL